MATSKTKFKLLGKRILFSPLEREDKTAGGIVIPDTAKDRATEGKVVGIGSGDQDSSYDGKWPPFKVGDKVIVGKWAGQEIILEDTGEKLYVVGIDEIIGTIS